jgi:hypothetical protein
MSITIGLDARRLKFAKDEIVVGRSSTADVSLPDAVHLADRHAILRKVAGKWLIEAQQDGVLRVGDGRPTKVAWLNAGDQIHLTDSGPVLTFDPAAGAASASPAPVVEILPEDSGPIRRAAPILAPVAALVDEPEQIVIPPGWAEDFDDGAEKPLQRKRRNATSDGVAAKTPAPRWKPENPWKPIALAAAAVFVIYVSWRALTTPSKTPTDVVDAPKPPPIIGPSVLDRNDPTPVKPSDPEPAAPTIERLTDAVYLVLLSAPDRDQTYRLGTAWAVDKRRLVTSAAVGQGVLQLREQLPHVTVRKGGEATGMAISQVRIHPEFQRIAEEVTAAQSELDALQEGLAEEVGAEPADVDDETRNKLAAAQEKLLQSLQQQLDFDLAVIEVDRDLPMTLRVAANSSAVRPGASVRLLGFPFPVDEFLVDPEALLEATAGTGQVQAKVDSDAKGVQRWLVKFRDVKSADNWSGAAVVNSGGEIIGVYSRPTPPPTLLDDEYLPSTHEVISIDRLKDIR